MKVKIDFVTNSSSSCFLLSICRDQIDELNNYVSHLDRHAEPYNNGVKIQMICETMNDLNSYTNDGPLDWASIPGGPQFINLNEDTYQISKDAIKNGDIIAQVWVDNNLSERFYIQWEAYVLKDCT
jgi:hypothetical protein